MTEISLDDRLAIHALVDRLVADGETFESHDASELIARLPLSPRSSAFQFRGVFDGKSTHSGYAAGVGQSNVSNDEKKSIEIGADRRWRIGGYKIEHRPGLIQISLLWEETLEDSSGQVCRLLYNPASRRPIEMRLARDLSFSIWRVHVRYAQVFDRWKTPI